MTKHQLEDHVTRNRSHSKSFKTGLGILVEEIELALQWNRPSILLAIHDSEMGRSETQRSLERKISTGDVQVVYYNMESGNPDVIRLISETPHSENVVFFVSGIGNADRVSGGRVYEALNLRRELLVEKCVRVVFWLNESEVATLPRLAPDFWAFRHRVVEFSPKRGSRKQFIPAGLFLWEEQVPWMEDDAQKEKLAYYEEFLMQLPKGKEAIFTQIETLLKLAYFSWLLNQTEKFSTYLEESIDLLEKYPFSHHQAWALNTKGIKLYEEGNKSDANAQFKQALSCDPDNGMIMMNASIALHGLGRNADSILKGRQAIRKDPNNFRLWRTLGYVLLSMGKAEGAIKAMLKSEAANPSDADTHYSLGVCYYRTKQQAECVQALLKAEKISSPQNIVQRVCIDILGGKKDKALLYLKRSLEEGKINKHSIRRDPNLFFLLSPQEFAVFA